MRSGVSRLPLEEFSVDGAIAVVEIGTFVQRDGDTRLLRRGGGRNQKRDSKNCGEREMHL